MKKFFKYLVSFIGVLFIALIVLSAIWYYVSFFQYKDEIDQVIANSAEIYPEYGSSLHKLAVISEGEESIPRWASERAYFAITKNTGRNYKGVINSLLWYFCIKLHYDQIDIFALWCHYSIYIDDYGLNNAALKYFGAKITDLSLEEKAAIVAMVKSPSRYIPGSEKSKERVKNILKKFNNSYRDRDAHH